MRNRLTLAFLFTITSFTTFAQDKTDATPPEKIHHHFFHKGSNMDAAIFSTSTLKSPLDNNSLSTLRFSYFFNFGMTFNHNFNNKSGFFFGANIKNIGFIEKSGDSTVKRRVYTIGVPVGLKFGNLAHHNYFMIGGGIDAPFNYKEKGYVSRSHKTKFNEWFSSRTPAVMPNVFAGVCFKPGITLKVQYYPGNFMNTGYVNSTGNKPYAGYNVNLLLFTVGMDMNFMNNMGMKHKSAVQKKMT